MEDGHELELDPVIPAAKDSESLLDSTNLKIILFFLLFITLEGVNYFSSWFMKHAAVSLGEEKPSNEEGDRDHVATSSRFGGGGKDAKTSSILKKGFLVSDRTRSAPNSQSGSTQKKNTSSSSSQEPQSATTISQELNNAKSQTHGDHVPPNSSCKHQKAKSDLLSFKRGFLKSSTERSENTEAGGELSKETRSPLLSDNTEFLTDSDKRFQSENTESFSCENVDALVKMLCPENTELAASASAPDPSSSNDEKPTSVVCHAKFPDCDRPFAASRNGKEITFKELPDCNLDGALRVNALVLPQSSGADVVPCVGRSPKQVLELLQSCNDSSKYGPWRVKKSGTGFSFKRTKLGDVPDEEEYDDEEPEKSPKASDPSEAAKDAESSQKANSQRRNYYSTGGHGQNAWLKMRLPRLDKKARARMRSPGSGGAAYGSAEREALEMYSNLVQKTETAGITVPDIAGPDAFTEQISEVRKKIEKEHKEAQDRFKLAKRLASMSNDIDQNLRLLTPAEEAIRGVHVAVESYKAVQKCWDLAIKRIRNAIDETEALKDFNTIEQAEGPAVQGEIPRIGLFEPYPKDTLPRRCSNTNTSDTMWESERLYDEAQAACARGEFCTANGYILLRALDREREQIQDDYPSRQRILRAKAYKLVCNLITKAGVHADCETHRLFMIGKKRMFMIPGRPEVPNGRACLAQIVPDVASTLGVSSSDAQNDNVQTETHGSTTCNSEVLTVIDTRSEPLTIDIPCLQGPSAFGDDDEDDLMGICISCLERPAMFIAKTCGHLVYCRTCQRKAIAKQLDQSSSSRNTTVRRRAHTLSNKQLDRTKVACPICRQETLLLAKEQFEGKIYEM